MWRRVQLSGGEFGGSKTLKPTSDAAAAAQECVDEITQTAPQRTVSVLCMS